MDTRNLFRAGIVAVGLAATLSAPLALAQTDAKKPGVNRADRANGNGPRGNRMGDLNLTAAQQKKMQALQKKQRDQMTAIRSANLSPEQRREKMRAIREAHQKAVLAILTPEQDAKYKAMSQRGPGMRGMAGMLPRMKEQLNLTSAQEKKIKTILASSQKKQEALRASSQGGNNREQRMKLWQDTQKQIDAVLTATQRAKMKEAFRNRGQGGPGGPRGNGNGPRGPRVD